MAEIYDSPPSARTQIQNVIVVFVSHHYKENKDKMLGNERSHG
jgi:hypothetical protein